MTVIYFHGIEREVVNFDITWAVLEENEDLIFIIQYGIALFKPETIERYFNYYKRILTSVVVDPAVILSRIEIISPEEKKQLLFDFNDTDLHYPHRQTIYQLFEEQVEKTPDHVAVSGVDSRLKPLGSNVQVTYRRLNRESGRLARLLREKGVHTDTLVALMAERSVEMIVGIWGILKAGGAYLPIETSYPEDRIRYMLTDSGTELLVGTGNLAGEIETLKESEVKRGRKLENNSPGRPGISCPLDFPISKNVHFRGVGPRLHYLHFRLHRQTKRDVNPSF